MAQYQGHRSWNSWNINLYINNEYNTYKYCCDLIKAYGVARAARIYARDMEGQRTPDGARYNFTCIRECFQGMSIGVSI